jgi:hypothetical protein
VFDPCCKSDMNRVQCQINLGKKLSGPTGNFTWYSFPKCVENSKWHMVKLGKSVEAGCLIDGVTTALASKCSSNCKQPIPSGGKYSLCFFDCFFSTVLGRGWNNGTATGGGRCG